jgi:hypothetical protein
MNMVSITIKWPVIFRGAGLVNYTRGDNYMDTRGKTHSKWAREDLEKELETDDLCTDPNEPVIAGDETPLKRNARRVRWYSKLGLNIKSIIEDMPVVMKYLDRQTKSDGIKVRLWPSVIKRIIHLKEASTGLFFTMSDVLRFIIILGLDIAEEIFKQPLAELHKNKVFKLGDIIKDQVELHSHLTMIKIQVEMILLKEIEELIDEEEADREIDELLDNAPTQYRRTIHKLIVDLVSSEGQRNVKRKDYQRKYQQEYRHLRLVDKEA